MAHIPHSLVGLEEVKAASGNIHSAEQISEMLKIVARENISGVELNGEEYNMLKGMKEHFIYRVVRIHFVTIPRRVSPSHSVYFCSGCSAS